MLQDMVFGRLENEFRNIAAAPQDIVLCFQAGQVLLRRESDDSLILPTLSHIAAAEMATPRYLFRMHEQNFFLWTDAAPASPVGFSYEPVRTLRQLRSKEICYAVMTGWYSRHALPAKDDSISLTREMIRMFEEGKEPK